MLKKILVVDDEPDVVDLLGVRLVNEGYDVIKASNGKIGIEQAKTEKPDLIILDIMMPEMDGYTAIKILKEDDNTRKIPVIILTCKEKMNDLFNTEGIIDYIIKPYKKEKLFQSIKKALGEE